MLRKYAVPLTVTGLLLALFLYGPLGSAPALAQHDHHQAGNANAWVHGDEFARALATGMDKMHQEMVAPSPTGNPDVDFLATMIPHHAGAVEMARLVLIYGKDPLVRRLAEEIIASQQAEMAAMEARLKVLRRGADPGPDGYPTLGGTRGTTR
jgi:uncharacterized protein (DUF305 family)